MTKAGVRQTASTCSVGQLLYPSILLLSRLTQTVDFFLFPFSFFFSLPFFLSFFLGFLFGHPAAGGSILL